MSEHQYYEFVAIDRPLSKSQIQAVRQFSSRAEISSTRFVNEYNWGDFRGDEHEFLKKYFDAMMYYANWGSRRFAFNLPAYAIDLKSAKAYCPGGAATIGHSGDKYIVDFRTDNEDADEYDVGDLDSMILTRAEILAGDLRPLYLGWLAAVWSGDVEDKALEPAVPMGLAKLSSSQKALAEFLLIDDDLIDAAAEASPPLAAKASEADFAAWVVALPLSEKDSLLSTLVSGDDPQALGKLRSRFRTHIPQSSQSAHPRRTAGELRAAMDRAATASEQAANEKAARERAKREAETARAQQAYLTQLAGRQNSAWAEVEQLVSTKQTKNYDTAVALVKDLRTVAAQAGELPQFSRRMAALLERHAKKLSFCEKVAKSHITPDATSAC